MHDFDEKYPLVSDRHKPENTRADIARLLGGQRLGVLSTCHGQDPHASLIGFAATADLRRIVFVTPRATKKHRNLSHCSRAALLIDNRNNRLADFHEACAVTAEGQVEEPQGSEREEALRLFLERHPHLAEFAHSPSCALLVIAVASYRFVNRFQHVVEIRFD